MSGDTGSPLIGPLADLPQLLRTEVEPMEARLRRLITTPDLYRLRQIVLIGCGDSFIAGAGAASVLREWTGLPVQPMHAMEAARYVDSAAPHGHPRSVLAVCISYSGEVARVVEAARRLRRWGALTVALTGNAGSRLAEAAELVGNIAVPPCPGAVARGYAATLLGVWLLGIRIAEVRLRQTMDVANARRSLLTRQADLLEQALAPAAVACAAAAAQLHPARCADLLGSGPTIGSARFAAAKLIEIAGTHAVAQDAEEFHHLNYFVRSPETLPTVVFTAAGARAASRMSELSATLEQLGRPGLLITDQDPSGVGAWSKKHLLRLPPTAEWLLPLLHAVPAIMLAQAWAAQAGATPFRDHAGPWRGAQDAGLVRNSAILPGDGTKGTPS